MEMTVRQIEDTLKTIEQVKKAFMDADFSNEEVYGSYPKDLYDILSTYAELLREQKVTF